MNKGGQFFLIAAIIIVGIVIGLGAVYTSVKAPSEDTSVIDLTKQVDYEAAQVVDNGVFSAASQDQINTNIADLTSVYAKSNPNSDLLVVYGDKSLVHIIYYNNTETGSVGISTGSTTQTAITLTGQQTLFGQAVPQDNVVKVKLENNIAYDFNLTEGQNFYIVIKKDTQNDRIIANK